MQRFSGKIQEIVVNFPLSNFEKAGFRVDDNDDGFYIGDVLVSCEGSPN